MNEFIEKLIGRLEEEAEWHEVRWREGMSNHALQEHKAFVRALNIINELAEEYKGGWIPCSERLPERNMFVLVEMNNGRMYVAKNVDRVRIGCYEYEWTIGGAYLFTEDVIAWQPLSEAYKPKVV